MIPGRTLLSTLGGLLTASLLAILTLPLLALFFSSSISEIQAGMSSPLFLSALLLSLKTSFISLVLVVLTGTPLAWWLATSRSIGARIAGVCVELPIVMPPAVIGVALLSAFGRQGVLGPVLNQLGISLPFTSHAVILAQIVVSAPFYIQATVNAFSKVDQDTLIVARTLGATPGVAFLKVAVPIAGPGIVVGASLAWARSLGEFGATLLFAGNLPGETQTMPLAIFYALESDVKLAVVYSIALAAIASILLIGLRYMTPMLQQWQKEKE